MLCAANVYKELGKPDDAYKSTKMAIDMLPDDAHNLYNHAAYAAMIGHPDESIDYLELRDRQRQAVEKLRKKIASLRKDFDSARDVAEEVGITDFTSIKERPCRFGHQTC